MASVKVAVRVRPLNKREDDKGASIIIKMEGKKTKISNFKASSVEKVKEFTFDHSYWSVDRRSPHYTAQDKVFADLGSMIVKAAFEGYNACIFAYGQTGSGKTYTMMGDSVNDPGLIPRICEAMFSQMNTNKDDGVSYRTEVSYLEIYKEHVRDLLRPPAKGTAQHNLKVREHPRDGIYVQDLTKHLVSDFDSIQKLMVEGSNIRVTASTNMNDVSSRSHAIFTISFTQAKFHHDMPSETVSKINLVDLAGSERADATGATGERLKEGALINKSLVTLGTVISHLADVSMHPQKKIFIPYRDSVLTWLLKDSLGGNSKTVMIATISPADINYAETLSTLRYANRAKNIINKPTVNEDANVKLIRELKEEIERLKSMVNPESLGVAELAAAKKLSENEARVSELTDQWKDRWRETQKILEEREMALQREGVGIKMDSGLPHLVLVDDDLFSTGIVVYHLSEGKTTVGRSDAPQKQDIELSGPDTNKEHCCIENKNGNVVLHPLSSLCTINGNVVKKPAKLFQGDVVVLGKTNLFRFNHPREAAELREKRKTLDINGVTRQKMMTKFRSESDLLRGFITGSEREEALNRELEEARSLLVQQKEDESLRIEKAKDELAAQLQVESKRLEETRHELEQQSVMSGIHQEKANKTMEEYEKLEERHRISETERRKQELIYKHELESRMMKIETQEEDLEKLREQFSHVERVMENEIAEVKERIFEEKKSKLKQLDDEMKRLLELNSVKIRNQVDNECARLEQAWNNESERLRKEKRILATLQSELESLEKDFEQSPENKSLLLSEKDKLVTKIAKTKERIEFVHKERERNTRCQFLRNEREVLDWFVAEVEEEMRAERSVLEERLNEMEAEEDIAADRLSEVELLLSEKTCEEDSKINTAQHVLFQHEEEVLNAIRAEEESLERTRLVLREESKLRIMEIAKQRRKVSKLEEMVNKMKENRESADEDTLKGEEDLLHELEENSLVEDAKTEELLTIRSKELNDKKEKAAADLASEKQSIEEMRLAKVENLQGYEDTIKQIKTTLEDARAKLRVDKRKKKIVCDREEELYQKIEDTIISISRRVGQNLNDDNDSFEELIGNVEEKSRSGSTEILQKENEIEKELGKLSANKVYLEELIMQEEKERENVENKLKELRGNYQKDRDEERKAMIEFIDNIQNEDALNNVEENSIFLEMQKTRKDHEDLVLMLELEKQQLLLENERLERERLKEKQRIDQERLKIEREKMEEIQNVIREKENELCVYKEEAKEKISELKRKLENSDREISDLQHKVTHYTSMINLPTHNEFDDDDDDEDEEIAGYLSRDNKIRRRGTVVSLEGSVTPPSITPPPTPVSKFLASVIHNKRNAIHVEIPRFRIRGIGRVSYHVFEVRITVGNEAWTVYRRYKKFREMHKDVKQKYPEVASVNFPPRKFFGNKNETFVTSRRVQLENYLREMLNICSTLRTCHLNVPEGQTLTKWDLSFFHSFFKQGIFEQSRANNAT